MDRFLHYKFLQRTQTVEMMGGCDAQTEMCGTNVGLLYSTTDY
jgi:hypothetical protein